MLIYTSCSQADKSPVIPPPFLLLPPVSVSSLFSFSLLPSLYTEQGQLENIPCSFLAQPRHSPGPLIKHKASPFLSLSSSLSHSLSLHCHLSPSASHPPSPSQQPLSIISLMLPSFHNPRLALHPPLSLPICHGGGLIFTLGQSSESICTKHRTCYSLLLVLTTRPVTSAMYTLGECPDLTVLLLFNNVPLQLLLPTVRS